MLAGPFAFGAAMTYTIYGDFGSGAFSSEAALAEAGAAYVFEPVSLKADAQRSPEFRQINPSGKMPALRLPDGTLVTESLAILLTVADLFPEAGLLPPMGSAARATAYRWLAFMAGEIYPMVEISDYPERFAPAGEGAEALRARAQSRIRENLVTLEDAAGTPWFLGERFSAVDIYVGMFSRWYGSIGRDWNVAEHIPKLNTLAERLARQPRLAPVWERHFKRK